MENLQSIRSSFWKISSGFIAIIILGYIDFLSGLSLSFSIFYILPIAWLTWHLGLVWGVASSVVAAIVWLVAEIAGGQTYQIAWAPYWNMTVRFGFFLTITVLLNQYKTNMERHKFLESLFFHDLLNLTGSLKGFVELLGSDEIADKKEVTKLLGETTERIIDEIESQSILISAESGDLNPVQENIQIYSFLASLVSIYQHHSSARNKSIIFTEKEKDLLIWTDPTILSRIIGNLIKNALEATPREGTVSLTCQESHSDFTISINNPGVIPGNIKKKMFKESISSKGRNRGLGLRSIQLLVEIICGDIEYVSNEKEGTTFTVKLHLNRLKSLETSNC